ncbi:unnamed protein product, partial [marine sediment metagenome]
ADKFKDYHPITGTAPGRAEIELFLGENRNEEAEFIAGRVRDFLSAGYKHRDIVVLFRGVKNAIEYEEALKRLNISTVTVGGAGFYEQREIKDILAMLFVIDNPHSEKELVRTLRSPAFGVRNSELAGLAALREKGETLFNAVCRIDNRKILKAKAFIEHFRKVKNNLSLAELINEMLVKSGLIYWAVSKTGGRNSRQMSNLNKFVQLARKFESRNIFTALSDFSDYLRQLDEMDVVEPEARPRAEGVVNLMSIHQAKGLEFPVVFVSNVAVQNFPGRKGMDKFHFTKERGLIINDDDKNSAYSRLLKDKLYLQ